MWLVYVLKSLTTSRFYVGSTNNLERRLSEHNAGQTTSTRGRGPWEAVSTEGFPTKAEATRRERAIKSWKSHRSIQELVDRGR